MSTWFAILSSLIRVYTVCDSQQSDQGLDCSPFSAVSSGSTMLAILSSLSSQGLHFCHSWQSDQDVHYLPFIIWSGYTLFAILSTQYYQGLHYLPFSAVWSGSTQITIFFLAALSRSALFAILSSLIRGYTICYFQQFDQGLHCLPFSAFCLWSILLAILSLIWVYSICHSQQSDQGLHYLPFSVCSGSTQFAILSIRIRVYTIFTILSEQT